MTFRNGLSSLLRPEDSLLLRIDHQPYPLANVNSHEPQMVINNRAGLAKAANAFGVPSILAAVLADRGGLLFPRITDVFPGQGVIGRTFDKIVQVNVERPSRGVMPHGASRRSVSFVSGMG